MRKNKFIKAFLLMLIIGLLGLSFFIYLSSRDKSDEEVADQLMISMEERLIIDNENLVGKIIIENDTSYIDIGYLREGEYLDFYWDENIERIQFFGDKYVSYVIKELNYNNENININGKIYNREKSMKLIDGRVYLSIKLLKDNNLLDFSFIAECGNITVLDKDEYAEVRKTRKITTYYIYDENKISFLKLSSGSEVRVFDYEVKGYRLATYKNNIGFISSEDLSQLKEIKNTEFEKIRRNESICLAWDLVSAKEIFKEFYIPATVDVIAPTWYNLIEKKSNIKQTVLCETIKKETNDGNQKVFVDAIADNYNSDRNANRDYFYDVADRKYIDYVHSKDKSIWATFNNSFDKELTRKLLQDGKARSEIVDEIINIALFEGYEGINIDFENVYMTEKDVYSAFIKELYCKAYAYNIVVSVDVAVLSDSETWSKFADRYQIGRYTDYVILMAYDQHVTGTPGSVADIPWIEYGVKNLLESVDCEKVIMAMPFYTRFWEYVNDDSIKSTALRLETAKKIIEKYDITFVYDSASGQNYYEGYIDGNLCKMWNEDETSLNNRVEVYKKYDLAGLGIWALDFGITEMWKLIKK